MVWWASCWVIVQYLHQQKRFAFTKKSQWSSQRDKLKTRKVGWNFIQVSEVASCNDMCIFLSSWYNGNLGAARPYFVLFKWYEGFHNHEKVGETKVNHSSHYCVCMCVWRIEKMKYLWQSLYTADKHLQSNIIVFGFLLRKIRQGRGILQLRQCKESHTWKEQASVAIKIRHTIYLLRSI